MSALNKNRKNKLCFQQSTAQIFVAYRILTCVELKKKLTSNSTTPSPVPTAINYISPVHLKLDPGTYVKEFVHGDLGRTVPSVGSLLNCRADILQLDVTNVEDKWSIEEQQQQRQQQQNIDKR